jgi:hypothetical protein
MKVAMFSDLRTCQLYAQKIPLLLISVKSRSTPRPYWSPTENRNRDLPTLSAVPQSSALLRAPILRGCDEQFLHCLSLVFVVTLSSIYCLSPWIYQASFKCYVVTANVIRHASSWRSLHLGCWFWVCKLFKATCLLLRRYLSIQTKNGFQIKCSRSSVANSHKLPWFYPLLQTATFGKCCSAFNYTSPS